MAGTPHREDTLSEYPDTPAEDVPEVEPVGEPHPGTASEEDHEDVDRLRGDDADAPEDTGKPEESQ